MIDRWWYRKNWPALAARLVPPLAEAVALLWARHRQHKADQDLERHLSGIGLLTQTSDDKDAEIARLAACQEELAQAQQTIGQLQKDLEAERRKTWWEKLLRRP